jgi:AbrB family looped-hinge helix DNA binding protein
MAKARINEEKLEKDLKENEQQPAKKMIMDIVNVASKNRMTIPSSVRNEMKLERGDAIVFLRYPNHIGMVKVKEEHLFEDIPADNNKK